MQDLVFNVSQGQSTSITAGMDVEGAARIAQTLAESGLKARYNVCVSLSFSMTWWGVVVPLLDEFCNRGLYFVADAITSDVLAGGYKPNNFECPYDAAHGVPCHVSHYDALLARYGSWFRGLRFHEVLTTMGAMQGAFPSGPSWWAPLADRIPPQGKFYNPDFGEQFVAWCAANGRPLFWSEPVTSGMGNPGMAPYEAEIRRLSNKYKNTVVPVWANNVAGIHTTPNAFNYLRPLFTNNTRGWGLSVQTWGNPGGGSGLVTTGQEGPLAANALKSGAVAALFEFLGGWIKWPELTWGQESDTDILHAPEWADRGSPLPSFAGLVQALMA